MPRPRARRPAKGDPITAGMSHRDIAATGVLSRHQIRQCLSVSAIPAALFEALVEGEAGPPTVTHLAVLGRAIEAGDLAADTTEREARAFLAGRAARNRERACPHCGGRV